MKYLILSTDTNHHRYFINRFCLEISDELVVILDKKKFKYKYPENKIFTSKQDKFEKKYFFKDINYNWEFPKKIRKIYDINSDESLNIFKRYNPNLVIVFGTVKLNINIIKRFDNKIINIHRGNIYKYRGLDSDLWSLYHNDFESIAVTIHMVENRLDSGDVLMIEKLNLNKNVTIFSLRYHTTLIAFNLVKKIIKRIEIKKINLMSMRLKQNKLGRYYSQMPSIMYKECETKLKKFIFR